MTESASYTPITDWSPEGRRALLVSSETRIRILLDGAFTLFNEETPIPWSDFGFRGDDPLAEAVDWCIVRFAADKPVDASKLHRDSRGFRLFTDVSWWLSQKVSTQGLRAIMARARRRATDSSIETLATAEPDDETDEGDVGEFLDGLGRTLANLRTRTCADLVAYWLDATERLRRGLGHTSAAPVPDALPSKQSLHRFDAMFRFWQLHDPRELGQPWQRVFDMTMLTACDNSPPYRVPDRAVSAVLGNGDGPREIGRARKTACVGLVALFVGQAKQASKETSTERWAAQFRAAFLKPTLAHALEIQDAPAAPARLLKEVSRGQD